MRYLNTVYVSQYRAKIGYRRGSLIVSCSEDKRRVPLEAIDGVVMFGGAQITTDAMAACVQRGVRVAALHRSGKIRFVVGGPTSGNVHLRTALYKAMTDEDHSLILSRLIVAAKLQNSRRILDRWSRDEPNPVVASRLAKRAEQILERVHRLRNATSPDHVRGIEGDAARTYFKAMSIALEDSYLEFISRNRRPPRDPVNAMLGFCYGLLVTEFVGAIDAVGMDHQLGFFHRPRSGRPSLALDLAEELRPLTDRFVVTLIRRRQVGPNSFTRTPGGAIYMSDEGRADLIKVWESHKEANLYHPVLGRQVARWSLPSIQATLLARHLRGDLPSYPPFILS